MIPRNLSEWTLDAIFALLTKGAFEDDTYDFKETLPDSRNNDDKDRLRKSCAAFANSNGGFLVFGVKDSKGLLAADRLVGVTPTLDFPEHFGAHAKQCNPSVTWEFKNPPLSLSSGNRVHVIWIPRSWKAPHGVATGDGGWLFPKRTNRGNEAMSIEEIRSSFLGLYEKRLKLQLLRSELQTIDEEAQSIVIPAEQRGASYSLTSFETAIIDSVLSDTYSITATHASFHLNIKQLRHSLKVANNKIRLFFSVVMTPLTNKEALIRSHNQQMQPIAEQIGALSKGAIKELDEILKM